MGALYVWSDIANLDVFHVSHAVDHFLRLLAEWIDRVILLQIGLQRISISDASRTVESTFGLLPCGCDFALGQSNGGNPWILKSFSQHVPP